MTRSGDVQSAALLLTDVEGRMRIRCLHGPGEREVPTRTKASIEGLLDAVWLADGLHVAANVAGRAGVSGPLAVLGPNGAWRRLDSGVRFARFSAEASAMLFEVVAPRYVGGGIAVAGSTTKVVDLRGGAVTMVGELVDPRWEVEGKSVLATRLDPKLEDAPPSVNLRWGVSRVRWDRRSRTASILGQGDAQIPSPLSDAIAWRDAAERSPLPGSPAGDRCALTVGGAGGTHAFAVEGRLCLGYADDRSVRFSPDGRWLAFASFDGPAPTGAVPAGDGKSDPPMFLRIVSPSGDAHPAAANVRARDIEVRGSAKNLDPASMRGGYRWLDWSPGSTAIVAEGPDGAIAIFDLTAGTRTPEGTGRTPTFDGRGEHLLVMTPTGAGEEALIIHREAADKRESLGRVRDARWLSTSACEVANGSARDGR
jgi:hypothetical protein